MYLVSVVTCSFNELRDLPKKAINEKKAEYGAMRDLKDANLASAIKLAVLSFEEETTKTRLSNFALIYW